MLNPVLLKPVAKSYLWGGKNFIKKYNKFGGEGYESVAESWELSVHEEGVCFVDSGEYAGMLFSDYLEAIGDILGKNAGGVLPLLVKFIDSADRLSVQVHPDDSFAMQRHGGTGKTEFWYIVDCADDAEIFCGLNRELGRDEFRAMAHDGSIVQALKSVKVKPGDAFVIPPGMVHAIGKDMTVAEVGTNCNITYRIYDYGRLDAMGNTRPLHVDLAAEVFSNKDCNIAFEQGHIDCGPFNITRIDVKDKLNIAPNADSFQCILCANGSVLLDGNLAIEAGNSVFVPAGIGYELRGSGTVLCVMV